MVSTVTVNGERCVVKTTQRRVVIDQHTLIDNQPRTPGRVLCYVRARKAARALHNTRQSHKKDEEKESEEEKKREQRVVLGGGARLADAATRHHLTQTTNKGRKRTTSEQNKHQRTQTIQKTSTRTSTSTGHHTLPSMRSQTPIQQQWTTQTQLSRGGPHNPSLVRRIQSPGQRKSPLRQMQQQTRQRQRRQRQSTPLPEKRGRTRQTTHRRHANTTHRHMVNHTPPFHNNRKDGVRRKTEEAREEEKRTTGRKTRWCSGITCVLAKLRAHYPEHQHKEEEERKRRRQKEGEDK